MKKLIERLLLFFLGLPLIVASVFFLPHYNYLFFNIEILLVAAFAIFEMRSMLSNRLPVLPLPLSLLTGMLIPAAAFAFAVFGLPYRIIGFATAMAFLIVLIWEFFACFSGSFDKAAAQLASAFTIIIYPGYLITFLPLLTGRPHAGALLSIFFMIVFCTDSLAWFFGMLFGKGNRGIIPASPNKSLMGFAGGYFGGLCASILGYYLFSPVFNGKLPLLLIIAFFTSTAAIVGDIIESILKRSTGIKDSGSLVPGRGGVLDSIDSVLLAAPVFLILTDIFLGSVI
ncbi:MAG: phosphatidate cytidylyltransferase [Spirochaetales bacterium]|nr:phosphatidate cytidylyltransferase [Spirochaetales bacterium]